MDQQTMWIIVGVTAVVVIGLIAWAVVARQRLVRERDELRARYGDEYDRTVTATGGQKQAAADLHEREREREALQLRTAGEDERDEIRLRLAALQYRFVDDAQEVLLELQRVTLDALRVRGYPVAENREQALRSLSVDHPQESGPVRSLLEGSYGTDVGTLQRLFIANRHALATVVGISYSMGDAAKALHDADHADSERLAAGGTDASTRVPTSSEAPAPSERQDAPTSRPADPAPDPAAEPVTVPADDQRTPEDDEASPAGTADQLMAERSRTADAPDSDRSDSVPRTTRER